MAKIALLFIEVLSLTGSSSYASEKDYQCDGDSYSSFGNVYLKYTEAVTIDYSAGTMVVT